MQKLVARARRDARRVEFVARVRLLDDTTSTLKYLYWRNRFPILTEIWARTCLLVELYLIYLIYMAGVASGIAFALLISTFVRNAHRGLVQAFRVRIAELQTKVYEQARINQLYSVLLLLSLLAGIIGGVIILSYSLALKQKAFTTLFSSIWILLLPIQLASSAAWAVLYTMQRMKRSLSVTFSCYALPLLSIAILHPYLGPYAYLLGFAVGRIGLFSYLFFVAAKALRRKGVEGELRKVVVKRVVFREFQEKHQVAYLLTPMIIPLYSTILAMALYARGATTWLTHFTVTHMVFILTYPMMRFSMSFSMDIYLALKQDNITIAQLLRDKADRVTRIACIVFLCASLLLIFFVSFSVGITNSPVILLAPYVLGLVISRTLLESRLIYALTAGSDRFLLARLIVSMLLILIAQLVVSFYFRANLQSIYLIEILGFFFLALLLQGKDLLERSPISQRGRDPWKAWKRVDELQQLVILNERYPTKVMQEALLKQISPSGIGISSRFYWLSSSHEDLVEKASYHIRLAIRFVPGSPLSYLAQEAARYRTLQPVLPSSIQNIIRAERAGLLAIIEGCFSPTNQLNYKEALVRAMSLLEELQIRPKTYFTFDGRSRKLFGVGRREFLHFCQSALVTRVSESFLLPRHQKPFVCFRLLGQPILIVDGQTIESHRQPLYQITDCFNLRAAFIALQQQSLHS